MLQRELNFFHYWTYENKHETFSNRGTSSLLLMLYLTVKDKFQTTYPTSPDSIEERKILNCENNGAPFDMRENYP